MTTPTAALVPAQRTEFTTTDTDVTIDYINTAYQTTLTKLRVGSARGGDLFRHSRTDGGSFALDDMWWPLALNFRQTPLNSLIIIHVDAGTLGRECGGDDGRFLAGDIFVDADPDLPATMQAFDVELRLVQLDLPTLARVAATSPARAPRPIRFTSYQPVSPAAAQHWSRTVAYLRELLANEQAATQPLILGNASRLLAATVLTTFPNTALTDPTASDRRDATSATVRRAVAFIEERAHTDISAADIATAANVSIRAVQCAFRRHLDTTPVAYLRTVRLDRAHHDLLTTNPSRGDTVTTIAARWGFYQHSRFAARYRHTYGVTPRHTLHNGTA
jgi:AraC-like DNA-binding protein